MHKALRTWAFLLMSGFNVELPLSKENFSFKENILFVYISEQEGTEL